MRLFKQILDGTTSLKEHLRTRKAPQTKATIADFVSLTLFPEETDAADRKEAESYLKVQLIAQLSSDLSDDAPAGRKGSKPSRRASISVQDKLLLDVVVRTANARRTLVRWLVSLCLEKYEAKLQKPRARSSSMRRASGMSKDGEEFGGSGDATAGGNPESSTKESLKVYKSAVTEATALKTKSERASIMADAVAEFTKMCEEEDARETAETAMQIVAVTDPTALPIPPKFWSDSFQTFYNVVGIDEFPIIKLTRVPTFDQILVTACKPFAEMTQIVNQNQTLYCQFIPYNWASNALVWQ